MLRIALVGAPNSGKSELARQISESFPNKKVEIVDDYIKEIEKRSDNTLSHFATYLGNIQAAIGRWEAERRISRDENPDVLVTCGTMIETIVYNGVHALIEHNVDGDELTLRALQNDRRASVSMTLLGIMNYDNWDYDLSFYLPLEDGEKWDEAVDRHISEAAEALDIKPIALSENRADRIAKVLQEVVAHEAVLSDK